MTFRIATYNIHRCIGRDGAYSPQRTAAVLRRMDADLTALQEVTFDDTDLRNPLKILSRAVGANAVSGPTLTEHKGRYGNAVLTRIAPTRVQRLDISVPGREPRGVVAMQIELKGRTVKVVATHLGLRPGERRNQIRRLMPLVEKPSADITILLGDFNEWFLWARPLRRINRHFGPMPSPATFPSSRPLLALDRIWIQPAARLLSLRTHRSGVARIASDHLPLVAQVDI